MQITNLLSRRASLGLSTSVLNSTQLEIDGLNSALTEGATDWRSLLAMTAGGLAYRATKLGLMSVGAQQTVPLLARLLSPVTGLVSEVTVYRGTQSLLSSSVSRLPSSWSTDFVNFASLKIFARLAQGQNPILSHVLQDTGMVAGHHLAYGLNLTTAPQGNLFQQLTHAEVMNIQMQAGMALGHTLTGGFVEILERSWELRSRSIERSISTSLQKSRHPLIPQFSMQVGGVDVEGLLTGERADQIANLISSLNTLRLTRFFNHSEIYQFAAALYREGLEPVLKPERFDVLRKVANSHFRRREFLRAILQREGAIRGDPTGVAEFVDFPTLKAETDRVAVAEKIFVKPWQKVALREIQAGALLADCNFGRKENYLHVLDHHGVYGQGRNSTEQMLDLFEEMLVFAGGGRALDHPTDAQLDFAIRALNIREISTDNLGDGGWCVWIAQNQRRVLSDSALRDLIRRATHFEDFTAFGNYYDRQDPAVQLQAAIFKRYGDNLRAKEIFGSDRFPPDKSKAVIADAMRDISELLDHESLRAEVAEAFWSEVDAAREVARQSVILERSREGRNVFSMYDLIPLRPFSIFAQWLSVPDIQRKNPLTQKLPLQATVNSMPAVGELSRILPIIAIPNGLKLPSGKGLLHLVSVFMEAERRKVEFLKASGRLPGDFRPNFWFGKEEVILPAPNNGGTLLTPEEIAEILMREDLALFVEVEPLSH